MADRYYHPDLPERGTVRLAGEVAQHLSRVMRVRPGSEVVLFDGMGGEADSVVTDVARTEVEVQIRARRTCERERGRHVELAWSPPRGARASAVLEHGTELGVRVFHPIVSERTPEAARSAKSRWQRVLIAAAGQCGAAYLPELADPVPLSELLTTVVESFAGERWVAHPGTTNLRSETPSAAPALVVVGPEGGFSDSELASLHDRGCADLDLGPHVLRTETAALAAVTLLRFAPPSWPK